MSYVYSKRYFFIPVLLISSKETLKQDFPFIYLLGPMLSYHIWGIFHPYCFLCWCLWYLFLCGGITSPLHNPQHGKPGEQISYNQNWY